MKGLSILLLGLFLSVPCVGWVGWRAYNAIQFDRKCGDHLKMAADANSLQIAHERLNKALAYIEQNHLTEGYTSVLWTTPTENVGEWYKNLKQAQLNLEEFPANHTEADQSTALVKLRETLLDHQGEKGDIVTLPSGISVFPYNTLSFSCGLLCFPIGIASMIVVFVGFTQFAQEYV